MKKLLLGKGLEERVATCSFCGEKEKECVKGDLPFKAVFSEPITEQRRVIEDKRRYLGQSFFSGEFRIKDFNWGLVVTGWETKTVIDNVDICKDCIRQLAKLI